MPEDQKLKKLHSYLSDKQSKGLIKGLPKEYESFVDMMSDEKKGSAIHSFLVNDPGVKVDNDFGEFRNRFDLKKKETSSEDSSVGAKNYSSPLGESDSDPQSTPKAEELKLGDGKKTYNYIDVLDTPTAKQFKKFKDTEYKLGSKGKVNDTLGEMDCSGAVCQVLNERLGKKKFDPLMTNSGKFKEKYANKENIPIDESVDGDLIVIDTKGKGINHVGMVVNDNGQRYIAETSSTFGKPTITPLNDRIKYFEDKYDNFSYEIISVDENRMENIPTEEEDTVDDQPISYLDDINIYSEKATKVRKQIQDAKDTPLKAVKFEYYDGLASVAEDAAMKYGEANKEYRAKLKMLAPKIRKTRKELAKIYEEAGGMEVKAQKFAPSYVGRSYVDEVPEELIKKRKELYEKLQELEEQLPPQPNVDDYIDESSIQILGLEEGKSAEFLNRNVSFSLDPEDASTEREKEMLDEKINEIRSNMNKMDMSSEEDSQVYREMYNQYQMLISMKDKESGSPVLGFLLNPSADAAIDASSSSSNAEVIRDMIEVRFGSNILYEYENKAQRALYGYQEGLDADTESKRDAHYVLNALSGDDSIDKLVAKYENIYLTMKEEFARGKNDLPMDMLTSQHLGNLLGSQWRPIKHAAVAGVVASIASGLNPAVGQGVSMASTTIEQGYKSFGAGFRGYYFEYREKGLSPRKAAKKASNLAWYSAGAGALEGALAGYFPAATGKLQKWGLRLALDATLDASVSGGLQVAENFVANAKGLEKEWGDGVVESMLNELIFSVGGASATVAGKGVSELKGKKTGLYTAMSRFMGMKLEDRKEVADAFNEKMMEMDTEIRNNNRKVKTEKKSDLQDVNDSDQVYYEIGDVRFTDPASFLSALQEKIENDGKTEDVFVSGDKATAKTANDILQRGTATLKIGSKIYTDEEAFVEDVKSMTKDELQNNEITIEGSDAMISRLGEALGFENVEDGGTQQSESQRQGEDTEASGDGGQTTGEDTTTGENNTQEGVTNDNKEESSGTTETENQQGNIEETGNEEATQKKKPKGIRAANQGTNRSGRSIINKIINNFDVKQIDTDVRESTTVAKMKMKNANGDNVTVGVILDKEGSDVVRIPPKKTTIKSKATIDEVIANEVTEDGLSEGEKRKRAIEIIDQRKVERQTIINDLKEKLKGKTIKVKGGVVYRIEETGDVRRLNYKGEWIDSKISGDYLVESSRQINDAKILNDAEVAAEFEKRTSTANKGDNFSRERVTDFAQKLRESQLDVGERLDAFREASGLELEDAQGLMGEAIEAAVMTIENGGSIRDAIRNAEAQISNGSLTTKEENLRARSTIRAILGEEFSKVAPVEEFRSGMDQGVMDEKARQTAAKVRKKKYSILDDIKKITDESLKKVRQAGKSKSKVQEGTRSYMEGIQDGLDVLNILVKNLRSEENEMFTSWDDVFVEINRKLYTDPDALINQLYDIKKDSEFESDIKELTDELNNTSGISDKNRIQQRINKLKSDRAKANQKRNRIESQITFLDEARNFGDMSLDEANEFKSAIQGQKDFGRTKMKEFLKNQREDFNKDRRIIEAEALAEVDEATVNERLVTGFQKIKEKAKKAKVSTLTFFAKPNFSFMTLIDFIDQSGKGVLEKAIIRPIETANSRYKATVHQVRAETLENFAVAFGLEGETDSKVLRGFYNLQKKMRNSGYKVPVWNMKTRKQETMEYTDSQLLTQYMWWQREDTRRNMEYDPDNIGGTWGYTQEQMDDIWSHLTEKYPGIDEFVKNHRITMDTFGAMYNETYTKMYGAGMGMIENYFPAKKLQIDKEGNPTRGAEKNAASVAVDATGTIGEFITAATAPYIKSIQGGGVLDLTANHQDFFQVNDHYFSDMSHFHAFGETAQKINYLMNTQKFKDAAERTYGMEGHQLLMRMGKYSIAQKYTSEATFFGGKWVQLVNNLALAKLGGKLKHLPLQGASFIQSFTEYEGSLMQYMYDVPETMVHWLGESVGVLSDKDIINLIRTSTVVQDRLRSKGDINVDFMSTGARTIFGEEKLGAFDKMVSTARRYTGMPISRGDLAGIVLGYYPIYKRTLQKYKDSGLSQEEIHELAIEKFELFERTQQSSSNVHLTMPQINKTVFNRMLTAYKSVGLLYLNQEAIAINRLYKGIKKDGIKGIQKKEVRRLVLNHFAGHFVYQVMQGLGSYLVDWMEGDERDMWESLTEDAGYSMITGSLSYMYIAGDLYTYGAQKAMGNDYPLSMGLTSNFVSWAEEGISSIAGKEERKELIKEIESTANGIKRGDKEKAFMALMTALQMADVKGLPGSYSKKLVDEMSEENDFVKRVLLLSGWSKHSIDGKQEESVNPLEIDFDSDMDSYSDFE